jgi:hypothetical protein
MWRLRSAKASGEVYQRLVNLAAVAAGFVLFTKPSRSERFRGFL